METEKRPVDVISVCSADGQIRPLRLQFMDDQRQLMRIHIDDVVSVQEITHVGAEAHIFTCRARIFDRNAVFELKYAIRSHCWCLLRRIK